MAPSVLRPATQAAVAREDAAAVATRLAAFASDPGQCARALTTSLAAFTRGTATLVDLRIGDAIAGRRGKAFLLLEARLRDTPAADARAQRFVFEFFADDDGRKVLWRMRRRGLAGTHQRYARYVPEHRMLIHEFPFDYRLDTLVEACSARRMQPRLSALSGNRALKIEAIDIVRYVPEKRCLIRYDVSTDGGRETWLGKVYVHDDDLASGHVQAALWAAALEGVGPRVPGVVGILPDVRLVVQRHVDGTSVYDSLRAGSLTPTHLAATARAAARLHATTLPIARRHDWHDELAVARGAVERSSLDAAVRAHAAGVAAQLSRAAVDRQPAHVAVHRDFYDKQVLVTPGGVTLIDFDTASTSYRELDVANFVAHLMLRARQGYVDADRAGAQARTFVAGYLEHAPLDLTRYRLTLATTWLRLAAVYAMRPLWRQLAPALVDLAERAVASTACPDPLALTQTVFESRNQQ